MSCTDQAGFLLRFRFSFDNRSRKPEQSRPETLALWLCVLVCVRALYHGCCGSGRWGGWCLWLCVWMWVSTPRAIFKPRKSHIIKSRIIILFFIVKDHVAGYYGKECQVMPLVEKDDGRSYLLLSTLYLYLYLIFSSLRNETFGFRSVFVRYSCHGESG